MTRVLLPAPLHYNRVARPNIMKIVIDSDSSYPVHGWRKPYDGEGNFTADVSRLTLARWERVRAEYNDMQDEMGLLIDQYLAKIHAAKI